MFCGNWFIFVLLFGFALPQTEASEVVARIQSQPSESTILQIEGIFLNLSYIYGSLFKLFMNGLEWGRPFIFVIWCILVHVAFESCVTTVNIWHYSCLLRQILGPLIVFDMYRKLFISEEFSSLPPSRYSSVQSQVSEVGSSLAEDHDSDSKYKFNLHVN